MPFGHTLNEEVPGAPGAFSFTFHEVYLDVLTPPRSLSDRVVLIVCRCIAMNIRALKA
jgi:hypothetical protein